MIEEHPNPEKRWKNRRRMAWACLWAGILYPVITAVTGVPLLVDIAMPFYIFCGSIVAVYTGCAAYETAKISMETRR